MNGATYLVKALENEGVRVVFGYPGGAIMPLYDALLEARFTHVLVRHEQGAALAADGYARATGKVGVCIATSGPGATNILTGLANAYLDSVPLVAITGQVATPFLGTDAFQEVDVLGMTMPVVKHSFLPRSAAHLPQVFRQAMDLATSGRPGPVLIDLPKDVSTEEVPPHELAFKPILSKVTRIRRPVERAQNLLRSSKRPLIYAGGGIRMADAVDLFRHFAQVTGIPVVSTLQGLGALPSDHPLFLGMLGMHGLKAANLAVQGCDLLIVVGARFDDRATGKLTQFAPGARVLQLDIDPAEVNKLRVAQVALVGSLEQTLPLLTVPLKIESWQRECLAAKAEAKWSYDAPGTGIYAPRLLRDLSQKAGPETVVSCDVGQHQMWVAQHYAVHHPRRHLTSGGLGTMGYGIPAAVGAQFGLPGSRVIAVTGDGSIMMNIQELATINRYRLPVKILLLDNGCLGLVRQWQELFFAGRYSAIDLSDNPDFLALAGAFGIPGIRIQGREAEAEAIDALVHEEGPFFVHAVIDARENVWPLVPPGKSNDQMMEGVSP